MKIELDCSFKKFDLEEKSVVTEDIITVGG